MSKSQSLMMRRRWKDREYRKQLTDRISAGVRRSHVATLRTGRSPNLRSDLPPQVVQFLNHADDRGDINITSCESLRVAERRQTLWRIVLVEPTDVGLKERYYPLVREHGLYLYHWHTRSLLTVPGVSVVLIVGLQKGTHPHD